ncbi:palmitoyltransferase ZDHHC6-like [Planococcus citri]|uniref:palmitoyltransferase ZDHHC6-like n=1 Tax=Planococcus citri TaxID=170843 RepID=UPI0031F7EEA8
MELRLSMYGRICHWGPIVAIAIIKLISWTTLHCSTLWLPFSTSIAGVINGVFFFTFAFSTVYNYLCAITVGPGVVPLDWRPEKKENEQCLQFCAICNGFKAPRSHHCRKCGRCVMKMDHHCPWLNNCVGHFNHGYFIMFLLCAVCGCVQATILLLTTVYKFFNSGLYYMHGLAPPVRLTTTSLILCIFSSGMAIGVFIALSFLLYTQMKSVLRNRTGIEDWILEKAEERRNEDPTLAPFIYPYNLGWYENLKQVFFKGCLPKGDGISWDVRKDCSEYDLTIEQLKQKELKKLRKKPFKTVAPYNGAICPWKNGICACFRFPWSLDSRMALNPDDMVLVTRYHKFWLFGEKVSSSPIKAKGWFPRSAVVPVTEYQKYSKKTS